MPRLGRKHPCRECPFRVNALPGWLGESTPEEFIYTTLGEVEMPCHLEVDYEDSDWRDLAEDTDLCAGSLMFLNNTYKLPRDRKLAQACQEVGRSDKVMSRAQEFIDYHTR